MKLASVEVALHNVERPKNKEHSQLLAEIETLQAERRENLTKSAASGGDTKLAARRRDIDSRLEEVAARCIVLEDEVGIENDILLQAALEKNFADVAIENQKVDAAKAAADEAEKAWQDALAAVDAAERQRGAVDRTFTIGNAITMNRNVNSGAQLSA
jgi:ElaB/YqjD/DUF883 family membrane-anchored ribosome-binding protein